MSRLRAGLWWWLLLALTPIALPQALWTRRTALRLPEASGAQSGVVGVERVGEPLRLLLIGESTVAGVGVEAQETALAGQLARALSARLGHPVAWRACGENGITAGEACERLLPLALSEPADLVLLVFGVNDTTHLSSLSRWEGALRALSQRMAAHGCRVVFTGVPPIQHFSALPWLLRRLLGLRAGLLDSELRRISVQERAQYARLDLQFADDYLARDGYHPSALGYRVWGEGLAELITRSA
ncbi:MULTISPECIES: SGNH/GDSL hydrolase family protein [unclassified Pseudomonas]|uniref:SGNH/GDSL hydrolase family protein n=1 Tax=unclassified Pseudomonas TaxID=196821 RepID=UPI00244B5A8A|nr:MULTISPECIES: SGNH/GDSL hydrolase family protein [unclassified Pseudomonas]MDG9921950.1 SGNH/GDSL hydrolase family protein [Pseudomonas sp. GD04045]MDH0033957.1 SGNH/GDSL hydrolase family protein [Pseudomonas sp. GD04019]